MSARRVSAIVLAGGRSSRFGRDKLAEPIGGRPLLLHAIDAVRQVASEVLVVVAPDAAPPGPFPPDAAPPYAAPPGPPVLTTPGVIVVRDETPFQGPLAGLLAGLEAAHEQAVLVVGGDMPDLLRQVIDLLLDELAAPGVEVVVLEHDGRARPLPMVVRRDPALAAVTRLIAGGERRLRALTIALTTTVIAEATWRAMDPEARSIRDIDTPDDLRQL